MSNPNGMSDNAPARVLVADDHPVVREGMAAIIDGAFGLTCRAQAEGVEDAIETWRRHEPDVGLFDLRMPDGDAVSAITRIRQFDPQARIVVISSFDTDEEIYRVMKAGARGYLLKDDRPDTIVDALRRVLQGQTYLAPDLAGKLASRLGNEGLSDRETEILTRVAEGQSNAVIAREIHISTSTIKFHLNNIYGKLGVSSRTSAVAVAVKRGIINIQ
ncbi:MAG: response regulator transcription factor [Pseudomonadota bacterium]